MTRFLADSRTRDLSNAKSFRALYPEDRFMSKEHIFCDTRMMVSNLKEHALKC